jgi:hypothetical protein
MIKQKKNVIHKPWNGVNIWAIKKVREREREREKESESGVNNEIS